MYAAVWLDKKYRFREIRLRHWEEFGRTVGFRPDFVRRQVLALTQNVEKVSLALGEALNSQPQTASSVYKKIIATIEASSRGMLG